MKRKRTDFITTESEMIEPSNIILQAFDVNNDWNSKNRSQQPKGRWQDSMTAGGSRHQGMNNLISIPCGISQTI